MDEQETTKIAEISGLIEEVEELLDHRLLAALSEQERIEEAIVSLEDREFKGHTTIVEDCKAIIEEFKTTKKPKCLRHEDINVDRSDYNVLSPMERLKRILGEKKPDWIEDDPELLQQAQLTLEIEELQKANDV